MIKIIGWSVIVFLAVVDFALVQSLILESNATPIAALLGALLFCVGLEGGPAFLGIGLIENFDKTRIVSGTGKLKAMIFIVVGGLCTIVSLAGYVFIRRDAVLAAGGFNGIRYEGFYGDIVLMIVPFVAALIAFGIGIWISRHGVEDALRALEKAQERYNDALLEKKNDENEFRSALTTIWCRHFPDDVMPTNTVEAIDKIRSSLSQELGERLKILLPQLLNEKTLVSAFQNSLKEIFIDCVDDPQYLSMVSFSQFDPDSPIGNEYLILKKTINTSITSLIRRRS